MISHGREKAQRIREKRFRLLNAFKRTICSPLFQNTYRMRYLLNFYNVRLDHFTTIRVKKSFWSGSGHLSTESISSCVLFVSSRTTLMGSTTARNNQIACVELRCGAEGIVDSYHDRVYTFVQFRLFSGDLRLCLLGRKSKES